MAVIGVLVVGVVSALQYPQELESIVAPVLELPQGRQLVESIETQGEISVRLSQESETGFEAHWDLQRREIVLEKGEGRSQGSLIRSFVLELHNAASTEHLMHLRRQACQGLLDRNGYVEAVEWMEYQSAVATSALLAQGIEAGQFPTDARMHVYPHFTEHFQLQKKTGHSAWIARSYDRMTRNFS